MEYTKEYNQSGHNNKIVQRAKRAQTIIHVLQFAKRKKQYILITLVKKLEAHNVTYKP